MFKRYLLALAGWAVCSNLLWAQDYIDLEAERLQQSQAREDALQSQSDAVAPATASPYSQPASPPPATTQSQSTGADVGNLLNQIELLRRDVSELRGLLEEQGYQLRRLKQQSMERYVDLDRRIAGGAAVSTESPGADPAPTESSPRPASPTAASQPGEADAYRAAYALVREQKFTEADEAFKIFLQQYPDGRYAPNAHYWMGELYLVMTPPKLEAARRSFTVLLEQYPENNKVPDALYKLGKVYFDKGDSSRAREYFDRVINEYGDSNSSAVSLTRAFLDNNY